MTRCPPPARPVAFSHSLVPARPAQMPNGERRQSSGLFTQLPRQPMLPGVAESAVCPRLTCAASAAATFHPCTFFSLAGPLVAAAKEDKARAGPLLFPRTPFLPTSAHRAPPLPLPQTGGDVDGGSVHRCIPYRVV